MTKTLLQTLALAAMLALGSGANAVVIYSEGADLDNTHLGTLVHASNLVQGSSFASKANGNRFTPTYSDFDDFTFTLDAAANVTLLYRYTEMNLSPQTDTFGVDIIVKGTTPGSSSIPIDPTNFLFECYCGTNYGFSTITAGTALFQAGTYVVETQAIGYTPIFNHGYTSFSYEYDIQIAGGLADPVPAPATLLMLLAGLVGLGRVRSLRR